MTHTTRSWQWYEDNADLYEEMDPATVEFGRQLLAYADPAPGARLLDVGAGRGPVTRAALARGCVVTAVDAAPAMTTRLRNDFPVATVSTMDVCRLDLPDASFDVVTAGFVIDLLPDPIAALTEMRRVLRPGGTIALSLPGPLLHPERWLWLVELAHEFYPANVREPEPSTVDLSTLLPSVGFLDVTVKPITYRHPVATPTALWDLFTTRLPTAISAGWIHDLPPAQAADFQHRFLNGATTMHTTTAIALDRHLTLHRARR